MATNNTYLNALEDLVIKGNLTVEGNVTQVSTTINENRVEAEEFIINSDGQNTTAKLTLNSNNTFANISYVDGGNMVVEPNLQGNLIIGPGQTLTVSGGATINGNVFFGNVTGVASEATAFTSAVTINLGGDATGSATFIGSGDTATVPVALNSVNSTTGSFGNANTVANLVVNAKGLVTSVTEELINITSSQVSDFSSSARALLQSGLGISYDSGTGTIGLTNYSISGQYGNSHLTPQFILDDSGRVTSVTLLDINIPSANVTDLESTVEGFFSANDAGGDGSFSYDGNGQFTYTGPSATEVRAHFSGGDGIDLSSGVIDVDTTVVRTTGTQSIGGTKTFTGTVDLTGATIPGNVTFGNITVTNIESATESNSFITAASLVLRQGASSGADAQILVERGSTGNDAYLQWNETSDRWQFSNDGSTDNDMLLLSDFSVTTNTPSGNGSLSLSSGVFTFTPADTSLYTKSTTNLSEGTNLYYTDERVDDRVSNLLVPGSGITGTYNDGAGSYTIDLDLNSLTAATVDVANDSISIIDANDSNANKKESIADFVSAIAGAGLIATNGVLSQSGFTGTIESVDVGGTGIDVLAGKTTLGNGTTQYYIRSIDSGTYTTSNVVSNVISIDGNISAIRTGFSGGSGITYNSGSGSISITDSYVRGLVSATGLLSYDSGTGAFTTTADNYGSWSFTTDSAGNEAISSAEVLTIQGGTNIDVTHSGNTITISNSASADITSVVAGSGLTGGATSGDATLNVAGGYGITVNADDIELSNSDVRGLFSGGTGITYNSGSGSISITDSDVRGLFSGGTGITYNSGTGAISLSDTGLISGVGAGPGLTGGGTTGNVTVNVVGGYGITVNADDIEVANSDIRGLFSAGGDLTYDSGTGQFSFTNDAGDITSVVAGNGLIGGATSGVATLNAVGGYGVTVNANNIELANSDVRGLFSAAGDLSYNAGAGQFSYTMPALLVSDFAGAAIQTGSESFSDSDTVLMTAAAVEDRILSKGYSTTTGTVTSVASGSGLTGGPITGSGTLSVANVTVAMMAASAIQTGSESFVDSDTVLMTAAAVQDKITSYGYSTTTGTVTSVSGGSGLSGSVTTSGSLNVDLTDTAVFTSTNTASRAVVRDGSGNFAAGTITATATQAQYADLAEMYSADAEYEPGTVLVIGGSAEVTVTDEPGSFAVVGVVSTDPAYLMNSQAEGVAIALRGRIPCKVAGVCKKGDVLITSDTPGHAMVAAEPKSLSPLQIVGRALENKTSAAPGVVEILV